MKKIHQDHRLLHSEDRIFGKLGVTIAKEDEVDEDAVDMCAVVLVIVIKEDIMKFHAESIQMQKISFCEMAKESNTVQVRDLLMNILDR